MRLCFSWYSPSSCRWQYVEFEPTLEAMEQLYSMTNGSTLEHYIWVGL